MKYLTSVFDKECFVTSHQLTFSYKFWTRNISISCCRIIVHTIKKTIFSTFFYRVLYCHIPMLFDFYVLMKETGRKRVVVIIIK